MLNGLMRRMNDLPSVALVAGKQVLRDANKLFSGLPNNSFFCQEIAPENRLIHVGHLTASRRHVALLGVGPRSTQNSTPIPTNPDKATSELQSAAEIRRQEGSQRETCRRLRELRPEQCWKAHLISDADFVIKNLCD